MKIYLFKYFVLWLFCLFSPNKCQRVCVCASMSVSLAFFLVCVCVCSFSEFTEQNRIRMGKKYTSIEQILFAFI